MGRMSARDSFSRIAKHAYLDSELAHRESSLLLILLFGLQVQRMFGERTTLGAGLLGTKVEGLVLLVLVELAEVVALRVLDDGEETGDVLAHIATVNSRNVSTILVIARTVYVRKTSRS